MFGFVGAGEWILTYFMLSHWQQSKHLKCWKLFARFCVTIWRVAEKRSGWNVLPDFLTQFIVFVQQKSTTFGLITRGKTAINSSWASEHVGRTGKEIALMHSICLIQAQTTGLRKCVCVVSDFSFSIINEVTYWHDNENHNHILSNLS